MSELQVEVGDTDKVRFTVTLKYSYEKSGAELERFYDTRDLTRAAEIDRQAFLEDPDFIAEDLAQNRRSFDVKVSVARITE